jgi:hypothetical protein
VTVSLLLSFDNPKMLQGGALTVGKKKLMYCQVTVYVTPATSCEMVFESTVLDAGSQIKYAIVPPSLRSL